LRHTCCDIDELNNSDGAIGGSHGIDECAPIGGVALSVTAEALIGGVVHVDLVRLHGF
jgi:hypothetical protein